MFTFHEAAWLVRPVVERAVHVLVMAKDRADDVLGLLVVFELGRLFAVFCVPDPAQHLVGHDQVRPRCHSRQVAVQHGRVHGVGRRIVAHQELVEDVELGFGQGSVQHDVDILASGAAGGQGAARSNL